MLRGHWPLSRVFFQRGGGALWSACAEDTLQCGSSLNPYDYDYDYDYDYYDRKQQNKNLEEAKLGMFPLLLAVLNGDYSTPYYIPYKGLFV